MDEKVDPEEWEEKGRMSLLDRANRRVREILDTHQPEPLDETLLKGLRKLADKDNTRAG